MLGLPAPERTLMDYLGGKLRVRTSLLARLKGEGDEGVSLFGGEIRAAELPGDVASRMGSLTLVRVGKTEHSMEGCACPMGAVSRSFLNNLAMGSGEWVLVDTEAGIEHFGRGVLEGADYVLVAVDPSHQAVILAAKALRLAEETGKECGILLSRVHQQTEPLLRDKLSEKGLVAMSCIPYSENLARAGLEGGRTTDRALDSRIEAVITAVEASLNE